MPVHNPGPRLYHSIPFKHLAQVGHGSGPKGGGNVNMNLTPFVDMMTILVTFLLMVFSASGEILTQQPGMELPTAAQQAQLQNAPVITVTNTAITFNNEHMTETESVLTDQSPQWKIVELFERMNQERQLFKMGFDGLPAVEQERCKSPKADDPLKCLDGLAILQADKNIQAKVISRIIKTANAAGYVNLMFAVERGESATGQ